MNFPTSWNLPHYFYNSLTDPRIDADIATWLPITREYAERYKGKIRAFTTPEEVLEYYEYSETMDMVGKKTMHYLSYLSALDTQDTEVQKKLGELEYLGIQLSELTLFVSQEWKELGAEKIRAFADAPILAPYRNDLLETANNVQYILDEKVEQALNKKSRALGIFGFHEELRSSFEFPWTESETSPPVKGGAEGGGLKYYIGDFAHIPYNSELVDHAREQRQTESLAEKRMWYDILKEKKLSQYKFTRQKPLLNYIADFYCSELGLVIEVDGDDHEDKKEYDENRTRALESYGLRVLRFHNLKAMEEVPAVEKEILEWIEKRKIELQNPPSAKADTPLDRGAPKVQMLTEEEIRAFAKNPDREIRKKAAESMNSVYLVHQNQITLGNLYTGIVKNWSSSMELRGYKTVMSKRNISEQVPDNVVDTLMSEVQKFYPLYQRFLRAKQKHLGLPELYGYDVHAPIFKIEKKIPYEEACKTVIEMFEGFDARFGSYARDMLEAGRVDAFPKPGKRGGAFASYDKGIESFVLLNYTSTVDDSFTLAHELGHGIHGHLAQVQKSPVYDAPLVLAETASIFSESLLMERISGSLTPEEKLELLNQKLLDVFGSIHRQIMYVSFERRVHEHIHAGGEMTYKELNLWWDEESKKLGGDVITPILPPEKNYTWSAIPHIFSTPFYCYAYSF